MTRTLLLLSFFCLMVTTTSAQNYLPPAGSPLANKAHPRIYLTADDLTPLRQRLKTLYSAEYQNYVNALDAAFNENASAKTRNYVLMDAQNYAFLYLLDPAKMTGFTYGHTRPQYGRKAIELAMAARTISQRGDTHSSAKLQSTDGAHHNLALAVVYDWTFSLLELDEKRALADALIQLYEERDEDANPNAYQKLSNQVTGYIHHGCAAALALWGDDLGPSYMAKAQEMLEYFNDVFLERTLITGDKIFEGPGWSEGASYYFLGITNVSFMAGAASSALGRNLFYETDILRRNVFYILYNALPLKLRGYYYMSRHDTNSLQEVNEHHMSRIMAISAGALRKADPDMAGLAKWMLTTGGFGLDVKDYQYYDPRIDDLFIQFLWGHKDLPAKSPQQIGLPLGQKLGLGEVVMKSSFDKENSTHIIFWAQKYWYSPHAHKDMASFTIYKHGSLALDSGNGKNAADFPDGEASSEAVFHNILGLYDPSNTERGYNYMSYEFSPEGGADHWAAPEFANGGRNHIGNLLGFESTSTYDYADYDYTRAYTNPARCSFARRRFTYLRGANNEEFIVIHDVTKSPHQKRFLLHTAYEPQIANDVITVTNNFDNLAHGRLLVKSVLPASKEIVKVGGEGKWFVDADWKPLPQEGPYLDWGAYWTGSWRAEVRSNEGEFLTVMQIGDSKSLASMAPVMSITTANFSGALINNNRLVLYAKTVNRLNGAQYTLNANGNIAHLIAGLTTNAQVKVLKNSILLQDTKTSSAGVVAFNDNPNGAANYAINVGAPLAVKDEEQNPPADFVLGQNYPNPFSRVESNAQSQTVIHYQLPNDEEVNLEVFDLNGRLIQTLTSGLQSAGTHQIGWDGFTREGHAAPAGMYFYRLQTARSSATKKLLLVR